MSKKYKNWNLLIQDNVEDGVKFHVTDYDDKAVMWHNIVFGGLPQKDVLPKVDGKVRVLDVGCNTGYETKSLAGVYDEAVGIDINPRLLAYSRFLHDQCYEMDIARTRFDDGEFSLVVAKDVLEHSNAPEMALDEIFRILTEDGVVVALIPLDGDVQGYDDVILHPSFNFGNDSHLWKATMEGVLRRVFNAGFTDIGFQMFSHKQLFGEERSIGDNVMLIRAVKKTGKLKVPSQYLLGNNYWAAFLTFNCTGNCWYCIQHVCKDEFTKAKGEYEKNRLSGEEWVEYLNSLQKWGNQKLGIIGGEPTLHPDFFDIINGLDDNYYITVTSNLTSANIPNFGNKIKRRENLRINTSFHPAIISVEEFTNRIHRLRDQGFYVDQIAMVDTPLVEFGRYQQEFLKRGVHLNAQTFLGQYDGMWYPSEESTICTDYGETGIDDRAKFEAGFNCKQRQQVLCYTNRFLMAPDGGIYRCHYHLYSGKGKQGDVRERTFPIDQDYRICDDFGFCNPCDYPHAQFKSVQVPIEGLMSLIAKDNIGVGKNATQLVFEAMSDDKDNSQLFNDFFNVLYSSHNPWWELYNNKNLHDAINAYINKGGMEDNRHLSWLVAFEAGVLKPLPLNVNIYRILDDTALVKYLAHSSVVQTQLIINHFPKLHEVFKEEPKLLMPIISKILATFGTDHAYKNIFVGTIDESVLKREVLAELEERG